MQAANNELPAGGSEVQRLLGSARQLMEQGRFGEALAVVQPLEARFPENRDVLYIEAVCLRYCRRVPEALQVLERLERHHPGYGRLFQERGHCYRVQGDAARALEAFGRAVELNSSLPASWKALALIHQAVGNGAAAAAAGQMATQLAALPPAVVSANSSFAEGDTALAEQIIRAHLQQYPTDIEAMRLLARIGMQSQVYDDAEFLLAAVLELAPDYRAARYEYALTLCERHDHARALAQAEQLLSLEPHNPLFRTLQANALVGVGRQEQALAIFYELRGQGPANPTLHLAIGHALKTVGRQAEAVAAYRQAAQVRPDFGDAYWSLANLKTYRLSDEDIAQMREQERAPSTSTEDRCHFCFALGKALEDRGEYAESFAYYDRGNALRRAQHVFDMDRFRHNLRRQRELLTSAFFDARRGYGVASAEPIFIVGLPRAGSTLIEQILASHSEVEGTKELADIPRIVADLNGRESEGEAGRYPNALAELTASDCEQLGTRYLADTRVYRSGRAHFIDKLPNNFRHIGLIHLILPNARIIDARRAPLDCCFSNFKQLFANGQEFTYGLDLIGQYYVAYVDMMAHWDRVLPGRILRVQHEDLVEDLEGQTRRLLAYLGLRFEPACLDFHRTERSIRTASSEQVRRPINRDGFDLWRPYDPWLGPLHEALATPLD